MSKVTWTSRGIENQIGAMLSRTQDVRGYLNRVVYPAYQDAQRQRWVSENVSEGAQWARLQPAYAQYKTKKFAAYPGSGTKILIATGRLSQSVIGPSSEQRKVVGKSSIYIATTVPYASYVSEVRDFSEFGPEFQANIKEGLIKYVRGRA